ncbi:hypothetical protein LZD60_07790 [Clostridium perfringens]|nr:hypothetical protein LZD60_07790 [Clostridium perfringens]
MLNIDRNEIKDTPEYESFGENEFPLKYLSEEELEELGFKKVAVEVEEDVLKKQMEPVEDVLQREDAKEGVLKMDVDVQMDLVVVRINKKYILI